ARVEDLLGVPDDAVGHLPGDLFVAQALAHELGEFLVEAAGFDQVGDDDWVTGGAGGAEGAIAGDEVRIDAVEPQLRPRGDERLQRSGGRGLSGGRLGWRGHGRPPAKAGGIRSCWLAGKWPRGINRISTDI